MKRIGFLVLLALLAGSVVYTVYDNQRFIVVEQEIRLERLPAAFDGFKILQISDLHGHSFGPRQADLIRAINALEYDMIAFTGDMNASTDIDNSVESTRAILDLLDGLERKTNLFWVDGNSGPHAIKNFCGLSTGSATKIGKVLEEKGVHLLAMPQAIRRGGDQIWITPALSEIQFTAYHQPSSGGRCSSADREAQIEAYYQAAYGIFQQIKGNPEVKILLDHHPQQANLPEEAISMMGLLDYDLILAGHYHGGQLRLPLFGAVYIPSPTDGINNSGFFPAQNVVKGLGVSGGAQQYVSAGLGASGHVRWLSFRMFNTPEINLITLRK